VSSIRTHSAHVQRTQHRGVFRQYKHHIPVLRINGEYWAKHRITAEDAVGVITSAANGAYVAPSSGDVSENENLFASTMTLHFGAAVHVI
jgi:hypothetical protein